MEDLIASFEKRLEHYTEPDRTRIMDAAVWAESLHRNQKRASGEPFFVHPFHVAEILVDMHMDSDSIIAGFLHDIMEDTTTVRDDIIEKFGETVAMLVDGVTKISILQVKNKSIQAAETMRKMLFAMSKDIRVIIIKLADKLHNMSTLDFLPKEKAKRIANECLDIYAPLAARLGISWMKAELEDLALKTLNPEAYQYIKDFLLAKKSERTEFLKRVEKAIYRASGEEGIRDLIVSSRAKHFYSIYRKMKKRKKELDEIYDLMGVRILCNTKNECYTILGIVHKIWPPIEGRFKDFIAMPKANQYQSLHTSVMSYDGRILEIQIRTKAMNYTAEFGVAAHWSYKQEFGGVKLPSDSLGIINKLKSWEEEFDSENYFEDIKVELLKDSIYVFTPKGHIVELPLNSTAIDFAYHIHTEIGNRIVGAKADGAIIPLSKPLKNTQVIEILTSPNSHPHINWLRMAQTTRARQKIRNWLNKHDESLLIDKSIIAKKKPEKTTEPEFQDHPADDKEPDHIITQVMDKTKLAFRIGNEKNMMISIAQCCEPSRGDDIVGYISRGRGIIVHRRDCSNLKHIKEIEDRSIEVEWEASSPRQTRQFRVTSRITSDLFSEIEGAVKKYRGHLIEGKLEETENERLTGSFTMEVDRDDDFKKVLKSIRMIPSILNLYQL
ncbi:MAG: bifunctional (p)ppGpp synthetase/guanosine-3',5'-bis(diphosphate) 3'-pyrophosphohydrolase [Spirochaetales bacterium]|nr:bifunctional (p)ppGpp synthetase/guanosine-3',5'-bis(diphosphate) 3'-pyrophosphohydrolase [Spirochaetales bacterium]